MLTTSNSISLIRAPLAFLFLHPSPTLRIIAILLAMLTDSIDGYLARKSRSTSKVGVILDPAMDKFFVYFAMGALFFSEGKMQSWEMMAMASRDFFLCLYSFVVWANGQWKHIVLQAIRWGKITTALQFAVLIGLVLGAEVSWYIYTSFIAIGWFAFLELFQRRAPAA